MNKRMRLISLFLLLGATTAFAQPAGSPTDNFQKMTDILPPAPNAASIIKNGTLGVSNNTGAVSINIPLLTASNIKLSTGVSLSYASTGIKVDELSGRVGMGWSLNAGGVITRTLRGAPDEWNTRLAPPDLTPNAGLYYYFEKITNSADCYTSACNGYDSEPDVFSFNMNGISGSFILDENKEPVLIPASKIKVQTNFVSGSSSFILTNTDGIKYYFGGTGAVEKTKRDQSCAKPLGSYIETAWYLTKIEHSTGEMITFDYSPITYSYDQGLNESIGWGHPYIDLDLVPGGDVSVSCPVVSCPVGGEPPVACANKVTTQGVLLMAINSGNNTSIEFWYRDRDDCDDKLLEEVKQKFDGVITRRFFFDYKQEEANLDYENTDASITNVFDIDKLKITPYLVRIDDIASGEATQRHYFSYDAAATRPPRLSYAQDHWGYFNGKHNTVLIPIPTDLTLRARFPLATANREVNPLFAGTGLLNKIVYPTGGTEVIHYQSNETNAAAQTVNYATIHELSCDVTGIGTGIGTENTRTVYFTIDHEQVPEIMIEGIANGTIEVVHNRGIVDIDGPIEVIPSAYTYHNSFAPTYSSGSVKLYGPSNSLLQPGTYRCVIYARGNVVTNKIKIKYEPVLSSETIDNKLVGGMRVKRLISTPDSETTPMVKRYYYGNIATKDISSLYFGQMPEYYRTTKSTIECQMLFRGGSIGPHQAYCHGGMLASSSINSLFNYGGSLASYGTVLESIGENMEGGVTETKYYTGSDHLAYLLWGTSVLNSTQSNYSVIMNGKLKEQTIYKTTPIATQVALQKKIYNYAVDDRLQQTFKGYSVNKKYNIVTGVPASSPDNTPIADGISGAFDLMGYDIYSWWVHPETTTDIQYDETGLNPVSSTTNQYFENDAHQQLTKTTSTNSKAETITSNFKYPSDMTGTAYTDLVSKNILEPVINAKQSITVASVIKPVSEVQTDYSLNITTGNNFPSAVKRSVKGGAFEIDGTIDEYDAKGNIIQFTNKLNMTTAIIYGYNDRYPVAKIEGSTYANAMAQLSSGTITALPTLDGTTLQTAMNTIRTALTGARVTSFTYIKGVGIASITDAENRTNTYEYDGFSRLKFIRDQDGNVVKQHSYSYAGGTDPNADIHVYYNAALTVTADCNNCIAGYAGSNVSYTVPYGTYYSLVDVATANAQAAADAVTNKQLYADKYGTCSNTATCTGVGYKFVNCTCEEGVKTCESSTNNNNGTYTSYYHYLWSDGSTSATYTETTSCSGADKKMINCNCETWQKVCEGSTNNNNGTYTVTYHYKWSDNSVTSPSVTETVACSGADKKMVNCSCETATKKYTSSVLCGKVNPPAGCCVGSWFCTFYYRWSDGSTSLPTTYTECSPVTCLFEDL